MKRFSRLCILLLLVLLAGWAAANLAVSSVLSQKSGKEYLVEINRISQSLTTGTSEDAGEVVGEVAGKNIGQDAGKYIEEYNLSSFDFVTKLSYLAVDASDADTANKDTPNKDAPSGDAAGGDASADDINAFFSGSSVGPGMNYLVKPLFDGDTIMGYVRYEYSTGSITSYQYVFVIINALFTVVFLFVLWLLLYIRGQILKPFSEVQDLPLELSKGRLKKGLKENKSRFFGRFVWGLDLLRESISAQNKKELALEKEKKTMILSISHGIKTPLSAIMLYSKALYEDLYDTEKKRRETALAISENAKQIEKLVAEIVQSQTEDLVDIEVNIDEFYLLELVKRLTSTYKDKLSLIRTEFDIAPYSNLLLKGDLERLLDVFENLIENAIKYGDGRRISLSFSKEDNCQLISVTNTGTPIPALESMHVFESFWRGSNAHDKPGNGLGLYICKHITGKMHGDIYINKIEDGMCFVVVIPIA